MKRLKLFIAIFWIAVSIPLGYVMWRTYESLAQEERAQVRFFSETLFDQIEKALVELVQREENRAVDEYRHAIADPEGTAIAFKKSPLAVVPAEAYILGYLQNNPDGSFQTPLVEDPDEATPEYEPIVARLKTINSIFNRKKFQTAVSARQPADAPSASAPELKKEKSSKSESGFADRFLSPVPEKAPKTYLGRKKTRVEEITAQQALNLAQEDESTLAFKPESTAQTPVTDNRTGGQVFSEQPAPASPNPPLTAEDALIHSISPAQRVRFQVEVAPFQSVYIQDDQVFIFRRIAINNQIYRQGFILLTRPFLSHLIAEHFRNQPLAKFMAIRLEHLKQDGNPAIVMAGTATASVDFSVSRSFAAPFDFFQAVLLADKIPSSPARRSITIAMAGLGCILLLGMLAIYQSARAVVDLSERRSQFVSSVTHELKTPLTNIRMYIEMLEQGIADTPEREQAYLRVVGSESARLSGLINNVLELSKLEKRQRYFHMQEGNLEDVLAEVGTVMGQKLAQENFTLSFEASDLPNFVYDRDVLIQILINLVENSIKFGRQSADRRILIQAEARDTWICIAVSDRGPGIPRHALKKVFDDFYRAETEHSHNAGGTGIGLALVKKFVTAMGGRVQAANNAGPGCTITIYLPR